MSALTTGRLDYLEMLLDDQIKRQQPGAGDSDFAARDADLGFDFGAVVRGQGTQRLFDNRRIRSVFCRAGVGSRDAANQFFRRVVDRDGSQDG